MQNSKNNGWARTWEGFDIFLDAKERGLLKEGWGS